MSITPRGLRERTAAVSDDVNDNATISIQPLTEYESRSPPKEDGGITVHRFVHQLDIAQEQLGIAAQELVMVTGDVDHLGAALAHGQQAADHVGMGLGPVHAAAHFPAMKLAR